MKSIIYFDIDGTLLDEKQTISESTILAIHRLKEAGCLLFLSTGRTKAYIKNEKLLSLDFDGMIAGLGTYIEYQGEILRHDAIDDALVCEIIKRFKKYKAPLVIEGRTRLYGNADDFIGDPFWDILQSEMGKDLLPLDGIFEGFDANKFSVNRIKYQAEEILGELMEVFDCIYHGSRFMEIVPKGYSKGEAIAFVNDYLGVAKENTYAFGDSANDLEMFANVGMGIAMGNACNQAKEAADFVTTSIHEDGIYHAIKHLGLI